MNGIETLWARLKLDFRNKITELKIHGTKFDIREVIKQVTRKVTREEVKKYAAHGWKAIMKDERNPRSLRVF